jgi:hypothetical protein
VLKTTRVVVRGVLRADAVIRTREDSGSILSGVVVNRSETARITMVAAWCPEYGASFRTSGLLTDVDLRDVKLPANLLASVDSFAWVITSSSNQAFLQDVIIDDVVIEAPCGARPRVRLGLGRAV